MKSSCVLYILLFIVTCIFAESVPQVQSDKEEILFLKEKIKSLEVELANYKKVKPLSTMGVISSKESVLKSITTNKKFILEKKIPIKLSTYYVAKYQSVRQLKSKLEKNGFIILAIDEIFNNKYVLTITNEELKQTNSFLATLHLLVNEEKEIRIQNPSYFGAAYLQEKFKYGQFKNTLIALENVFGEMYETEDRLNFTDLWDYNFMLGMPHFEDTFVIGRGDYVLKILETKEVQKNISYKIKLPNGAILIGHKLKNSTYAYLDKIAARNNALIFPYQVMIKGEKAYMLSPRYYLALSLPMLSMTDFMKIASAPQEIKKEIKQIYNKIEKKVTLQ